MLLIVTWSAQTLGTLVCTPVIRLYNTLIVPGTVKYASILICNAHILYVALMKLSVSNVFNSRAYIIII